MGRVDLVLRQSGKFRRLFALKRPHPHLLSIPAFEQMFFDEANLAGLIHHPNVVSVVEVGSDRNGPFMLMEYVEGITAAQLIERTRADNEWIPQSLAVDIIRQAAEGLASIHGLRSHDGKLLRVIHRDISPQNLLIGFDGNVRISDMGVAKSLDSTAKTTTGLLKGKAGYMSPEQLRFEPIDLRSDLFALGVVFFELLAGTRLYSETDARQTAARILHTPPPDIYDHRLDIHEGIAELLFELLAKTADARPRSAGDVARRLTTIQQQLQVFDEGTPALPGLVERYFPEEVAFKKVEAKTLTGAAPASFHSPAKKKFWFALAAVATLALGAAGAGWLLGDNSSAREENRIATTPVAVHAPPPMFAPISDAAKISPASEAGPLLPPDSSSVPDAAASTAAGDAAVEKVRAPAADSLLKKKRRRARSARMRARKRRKGRTAKPRTEEPIDRPGWDWND